jgi:hypothetical protein
MDRTEAALRELVALATRHSQSNMLVQFALSRKTQSLVDEAAKCFADATAKLQLGIAVANTGVNLRIDEHVTVLMK